MNKELFRITLVNVTDPENPTIMPSFDYLADSADDARDYAIYMAGTFSLMPSQVKIGIQHIPFR